MDANLIIASLYGMKSPDVKYIRQHQKKVAEIIAKMGDKYLLATKVEKGQINAKN